MGSDVVRKLDRPNDKKLEGFLARLPGQGGTALLGDNRVGRFTTLRVGPVPLDTAGVTDIRSPEDEGGDSCALLIPVVANSCTLCVTRLIVCLNDSNVRAGYRSCHLMWRSASNSATSMIKRLSLYPSHLLAPLMARSFIRTGCRRLSRRCRCAKPKNWLLGGIACCRACRLYEAGHCLVISK